MNEIKIISESVMIDIVPRSRHSAEPDLAKITANILLEQPLPQATEFRIPNFDGIKGTKVYLANGQQPVIGDFDPMAVIDFGELKTRIDTAVSTFKDTPTLGNMQAISVVVAELYEFSNASQAFTVPAGETYITFQYTKVIAKDEDTGLYTFETNLPMSSFMFRSQAGDKASIVIGMPIDIQNLDNVIEHSWKNPAGVQDKLSKKIDGGRILLTGYWQNDPLVRVVYRY